MFLVNPQCKTPVQVRSADLGKVAIDQAGLCSDASNVHLQLLFMITANTISSGKGVNPRMIGLSAKAEHTCACLPHSKLFYLQSTDRYGERSSFHHRVK